MGIRALTNEDHEFIRRQSKRMRAMRASKERMRGRALNRAVLHSHSTIDKEQEYETA